MITLEIVGTGFVDEAARSLSTASTHLLPPVASHDLDRYGGYAPGS